MDPTDKPPRRTLKLRAPVSATREAAPRASQPQRITPAPQPKRTSTDWAEAHKSQMQADMDELAGRFRSR